MKQKEIKPTSYISLAEYAWEFHRKNDLNMADAIKIKEKAFNEPVKKIGEKKDPVLP